MQAMNVATELRVEKIEYAGSPNCYRIGNGSVRLIITGDVGPPVPHYGFIQNLFKVFPDVAIDHVALPLIPAGESC